MKKYYVASCSFGKDSLCMVLKLLELKYCLDEIIFFDFGMEFDAIYNNKEKFKKYLEEYNKENKTNIIFTELKSPINFYKGFSEIEVKHRDEKHNNGRNKGYSWCGLYNRWGTSIKVKTIKEHLKEHMENGILFQYIGLAVDEPKRIIKVRQERRDRDGDFIKLYPLAELGMTEADCLKYCRDKGWNWKENNGVDIYDVCERCSCKFCRFLNYKDLYNYYKYLPHVWEEFKQLQLKTYLPFVINYKGRGKDKTIQEMEEIFEQEDRQSLFNLNQAKKEYEYK